MTGTTVGHNSEKSLLAEAARAIDGEEILAAGIFTLEDMIKVAAVGGTAGSVAGGLLTDSTIGSAAGTGLGLHEAKKAYAESKGMTVELVVAVTADHIHVLNRDTGGRLPTPVASFDRATCQIEVKRLGPSKFFHLTDPATGQHLELGGTSFSSADRLVMHLLSD